MGEIVTNPPSVPNTVSDSWQPLVDRDTMSYYGMNEVTLTSWDDSTTRPEIAQGSAIDIDGSVARFTADEAISGSPTSSTYNYVKLVVSGSVVTAEFTETVPSWDATKAGWYNGSGERYTGHVMYVVGTSYTNKYSLPDRYSTDSIESGGGYLVHKVMNRTRGTGGIDTWAHEIEDGENRIVSVSAFAFKTPNNFWYDMSGMRGDTAHRDIQIQWTAANIVIVDIDLDTINLDVRILIHYKAI